MTNLNATAVTLTLLNNPPSIFRTFHYDQFLDYQAENLKLFSQQYTAWSDCMDVQAGLVLYRQCTVCVSCQCDQCKNYGFKQV